MPPVVRLDERVDVVVRLSRGQVQVDHGQAHDEQVIVVDPDKALTITVLRRGFALARSRSRSESGQRKIRLPAPGKPDVERTFRLLAVAEGVGEVQVVVRQDAPQPLATLRLTSTVLPRTAGLPEPAASGAGEVRAAVASSISPFLAPKTLTIDENLEGGESTLTFELVLPEVRQSYEHVVNDKPGLLNELFRGLDDAWQQHRHISNLRERSAALQESLRSLGEWLADRTLPPALLGWIRDHPEDIDELTIITSGETDLPWELVHTGDGPDPDGLGFLGRAGLVRWIYNTPHPVELRIRPGAAYHLVPEYVDPGLALQNAALEVEALDRFGARPISPSDAVALSRLLSSGEVDLLHFAGHGRCDDAVDPPVREMLLANYVPPSNGAPEVADQDRSLLAYSLDDLRRALPDHPPSRLRDPGPLVVLNACRLGQPPSSASEVGGFAEAFLRAGAGAFVGCLWSIGDEPARSFVNEFYARLDAGSTVAEATIAARRAARQSGDLSWLAYTVYAHPDAHLPDRALDQLSPPSVSDEKGTQMTTTASTARRVELTREQLVAMHPYVINTPDGQLALGQSVPPTSVEDFKTVEADVDAIFDTHLPAFLKGRRGKLVPLVIYAHGGLVGKASGLGVAHKQIDWWLANDAFPVHFVWETGLLDSLMDAIQDKIPGGARGFDDIIDFAIEKAARGLRARGSWGAMKRTAELASGPGGGARYFARRLGEFMKANPDAISVHAVGHSAGSIFHSHLVPQLHAAGVPTVASLNLLAPAVRVDEFRARVLRKATLDRIDALTMFTMSESFEKKDTCMGIYHKSLLYLIRAALEPEEDADILGLQECVWDDAQLRALFGAPGSGSKGEVMWSKTVGGGPLSSSFSTSHGGFDDDPATMESLARRILGTQLKQPFPKGARVLDEPVLTTLVDVEPGALSEAVVEKGAKPRKKALCIGINDYPGKYALSGCVSDAEAWAAQLKDAGFAVDLLLNEEATREEMVERIQHLVVSSRAGDILAIQYSGHGTFVDDLDRDELEEDGEGNKLADEAICPVDFLDGNLLIDDDLGEIWDQLPDGVSLTTFFDSCHSGGGQRAVLEVPTAPDAKARLVTLDAETVAAFTDKRGARSRSLTSRDRERGVFFGACLATEVAWESGGSGEFTRRAVPLLGSSLGTATNKSYFDGILEAFGDNPAQTPVLKPDNLASRALLGPVGPVRAPATVAGALHALPDPAPALPGGPVTERDRAIASILRGVADLIES